jgi:hypothetical protein
MKKPKNSRKGVIRNENNPHISIFFKMMISMPDIATTTGMWQ